MLKFLSSMELKVEEKETLSLEEYIKRVKENPILASHSSKLLIEVIDDRGKRKVTENGKSKNRYKIFDNPSENGKYKIIGNNDELNNLVDKLRGIAVEYTNDFQLLAFTGPTASGKSEIKECLISEFMNYINKEIGGFYTVEFRVHDEWRQSPVRINPICLLADDKIDDIINEINEKEPKDIDFRNLHSIDPVSSKYLDEVEDKEFEIRVVRRKIKKGEGIGVIKSEDEGTPREKMSGVWIGEEIESGERNPESFSFEGLLSQGNNGISFIEEGTHHLDMIEEIIDFSKNGEIKIDNDLWLDLDTVIFLMSRENLEEELKKEFEDVGSIKRRMRDFKLGYLSDYKLEEKLLWKMLKGRTDIENVCQMKLNTSINHEEYEKEIPPHGIEVAALFNVLTRLKEPSKEKALKLEKGKIKADRLLEGLSPTFSRDLIANIVSREEENSIIPPNYIIDKMDELSREDYSEIYKICSEYLYSEQEDEVVKSIMKGNRINEENLMEYVKNVFIFSPVGLDKEPDHQYMREYEIENLGISEKSDYNLENPEDIPPSIEQFRLDKIADPLSKTIEKREFVEDQVFLEDIDLYEKAIKETDWEDVKRVYNEDIDLEEIKKEQPFGKNNEEIRKKAIKNLKEKYGYTDKSADFVIRKILSRVQNSWDEIRFEEFNIENR